MSFDINKFDFFDTHCHLNLIASETDVNTVIENARNNKVFMNCVGVDYNSSVSALKIVEENNDCCICSIGIHPESVNELNRIEELEQLIIDNRPSIYGIGECGLDFHYENYDKNAQIALFKAQIDLAIKYSLPLIIHCRDAYEELNTILKEYKDRLNKILIHCYDSDRE
jgi:TatD DNase family protein